MIRDACLSYFTPEEIMNTLRVFPISPKVLDSLMPTNIGGDTLSGGSVRGECRVTSTLHSSQSLYTSALPMI